MAVRFVFRSVNLKNRKRLAETGWARALLPPIDTLDGIVEIRAREATTLFFCFKYRGGVNEKNTNGLDAPGRR